MHPSTVRRTGGANARPDRLDRRRRSGELWRIGSASEPVRTPLAGTGGGAGGDGRNLSGEVGRDDGRIDGSAEGRRGLFAAGSGLSTGAALLHAGGCRRNSAAERTVSGGTVAGALGLHL